MSEHKHEKHCHDHEEHEEHCHCHDHEAHEKHEEHCHCHDHEEKEEHCHCHDHGHDDECGCGCGHDHGHGGEGSTLKNILLYTLGAIPVIIGFIPFPSIPWLPLVASVIGYVLFGFSVYVEMLEGFFKKKIFTEFTLMCVATFGAFCIGEYADAAAVMYLYSLGEMISGRAYARSRKNISELIEITPEYASVLRDGEPVRVVPEDVRVGESILVRAGERVPLDGVVISGGGYADASSVTGEEKPLELYEGVACPSGAILSDGSVTLRAEREYKNSVVAQLAEAVALAEKRKSSAERKIARFAKVFTPSAFALAAAIMLIGGVATGAWTQWVRAGLTVLVISCPCSLVLSVPLAYFAGLGAAARKGIIFRGGEIMDTAARISTVAFDKTGTLTEVSLSFDGAELFDGVPMNREEFLDISYAVLLHSPHAAAEAFCRAEKRDASRISVTALEIVGGRGVVCLVDGRRALFGNTALMRENHIECSDSDTTAIFCAYDGILIGRLDFSSRLKEGVKKDVEDLRQNGVTGICVLSGDTEGSVAAACREAGIGEFHAELTPLGKLECFETLYAREKTNDKNGRIAFCGDGLNDSAVITRADVGIAMGGSGSALTVTNADIIIMNDDISAICEAIKISRRTERVANVSIALSLGIKIAVLLLGVAFAAFGLGEMPLGIAVVADVGAAIVSVLNSARAGRSA